MKYVFLSHVDYNLTGFRMPIMRSLVMGGNHVIGLCPDGTSVPKFSENGIQHISYEVDRSSYSPFSLAKTILQVRGILRQEKPDILHTFTLKPAIIGCLASLFLPNTKVVCSITGMGSFFVDRNVSFIRSVCVRIVEKFLGILLRKSDRVIVQNHDDFALVNKKMGVAEAAICLIRGSGVDVRRFRPPSKEERTEQRRVLGIADGTVAISFIARLIRHKGIYELMAAAQEVQQRLGASDIVFLIVGDPDPGNPTSLSKQELSSLRSIGFIKFLGHSDDVRPILWASDIYCLPSYREGLPMSVLEAMACALPCVVTDVPGCREVVASRMNGLLSSLGDIQGLADNLVQMIEKPESRREWGIAGRQRAEEEFALTRVVDAHLALYNELSVNGAVVIAEA